MIKKDNYILHKHITTEKWCETLKGKYKIVKVSVRVSGTLSPRPAVQHVWGVYAALETNYNNHAICSTPRRPFSSFRIKHLLQSEQNADKNVASNWKI